MAMLYKAKLSDITPIFNLIQECSESGHLNDIYLTPPHQTGVALQLFSVWLFKRIRLPSGTKYKATLHVIRHEGVFAGFILMRYPEPSGASQEIYMCAIKTKYRGKGFGRRMIQSVLNNLKSDAIVEAECSSKAVGMKRLLRSMGFESINPVKATLSNKTPERFRISCALKQE
jgi:N-acetylglutamate synthase-like GNAT family acetyltransferase